MSLAPFKTALTMDAGGIVPEVSVLQMADTGGAVSTSETAGPSVIFADALFDSPEASLEAFKSVLMMADVVIDEGFIRAPTQVRPRCPNKRTPRKTRFVAARTCAHAQIPLHTHAQNARHALTRNPRHVLCRRRSWSS